MQKLVRLDELFDWGEGGMHGRLTFNAWAAIGGHTEIAQPLSNVSEFLTMWTPVPAPLRNLIGRVHFEAFSSALLEADLVLQQQRHNEGDGLVSNIPGRLDIKQAREVVRYFGGWMCTKATSSTQPRKGSPKEGSTSANKDRNPLHSAECKVVAR